jgi:hypothetical protein
MPRPPPREATGDGEEGGCRLARVHEAGKPQWILWSVKVCASASRMSIGPWSNIGGIPCDGHVTERSQMHVCEAFFPLSCRLRRAILWHSIKSL